MDELETYFISLFKAFDGGQLGPDGPYPDPAPPVDLGTPLTQDEIDFVKKLKKEMAERFNPP